MTAVYSVLSLYTGTWFGRGEDKGGTDHANSLLCTVSAFFYDYLLTWQSTACILCVEYVVISKINIM